MTGRRGWAAFLTVSAVAGLLAACALPDPVPLPSPAPSTTAGESRSLQEVTIADGLAAPWSIAFHDGTALISERDSARIVELTADGTIREVGEIAGVETRGEGGLLGIAVRDDRLYAYSTTAAGNRVQRFVVSGAAGALELGKSETILSGIPAGTNHNGGRIAFGPDRMLYVTTGDAGDRRSAQDLESLAGKILRIAPTGSIPADNPFEGSPVYSYGHRNPQGLAWDDDGTMYASEFGQDTWDELNVIEAGSDYGWPDVEGIADRPGFIDPVQQWSPSDASPSGIAITDGRLFIANLRGERIRETPLDDLAASHEHVTGVYGRLRDVVVAPDGVVWMLTNNTDGRGDPRPGDDRVLRLTLG
ncbi:MULTISPECIES: sorbosone dehydrogenase family protein [unclassified Microbacterium]|uniref:PQQ-dependent sugar dehydrogenase n=1 Tax=unclassified Microbacterium TaxID=2609290 RepID=UPI001604BD25|nr:PQQ-dependent sugar dehydrogenase [Microbacterium sp. Se63.02b]QNA94167.1 PQQ-dependent sugar dehydrogenase [Microbacterium sp. Se63.02b]